jgi:hypothetical protein
LHYRVTSATTPLSTVHALLAGAIDYAGLFPPARLDLPTALASYLTYRSSPEAWALGRFVVPAALLPELERLLRLHRSPGAPADRAPLVPISVLLGTSTAADVDAVERFNGSSREHGGEVVSVETRLPSEDMAAPILAAIPQSWTRYLEVPLAAGNTTALEAVARSAAFAKIRTGGTTPDAFPGADELLRFLEWAAARKLPFKATAGLHHPWRGVYPLSDAQGEPGAPMFGYLNLLLSATILWSGGELRLAKRALLEADPRALRLERDALLWRELRLERATLVAMRTHFCHGFGSCSFRQPLDELAAVLA